jgi:hypothetical protein
MKVNEWKRDGYQLDNRPQLFKDYLIIGNL